MRRVRFILVGLMFALLFSSIQAQDSESSRTMVAWEADNQIFVWETGDDAPRLVTTLDESVRITRVLLAPDGQHILLDEWMSVESSSPSSATLLERVYILDTASNVDSQPRLLFESSDLITQADSEATGLMFNVNWVNPTTLYFNTYEVTGQNLGDTNDDLWRVDIITGELRLMFPPTMGGLVFPSPDASLLAVITPGVYQETDVTITLTDTRPRPEIEPRVIFSFPAVSTGSELPFYPSMTWLDERTIWMEIPDPDLIYQLGDDVQPTQLWEIDVLTGETTNIGEVITSYFERPGLSPDRTRIIWTTSNFNLYVANRNGTNPELIEEEAGFRPTWLNNDTIYYETLEDIRIQVIGNDSQRFPNDTDSGNIVRVTRLDNGDIVYIMNSLDGVYEIRLINVADIGSETTLIANLGQTFPLFDALVIEE